jgi:hypothetical protein
VGFARATREFDAAGRPRLVRFFDAGGAPGAQKDGCWARSYEYLEGASPVLETCLAAGGQKVMTIMGFVSRALEYNQRGDLIEVSFLDREGRLVNRSGGVARERQVRDDRGNQLRVPFFDRDDKPVAAPANNAHTVVMSYDASDRRIETAFFDTSMAKVSSTGGYARVVTEYDAGGAIALNTYLDTAGQPVTVHSLEVMCVPYEDQSDGKGPADRDEAAAREIAEEVRASLAAGMSMADAWRAHLGTRPAVGGLRLSLAKLKDRGIEELAVGAVSPIDVRPTGLCLYLRTTADQTTLP